MISLVNPFGSSFAYNAAQAFHDRGRLAGFHTCLFNPFGSGIRYHSPLGSASIHTHALPELIRLVATKLPGRKWNGRSQAFVDLIGSRCDLNASRTLHTDIQSVYCYEDFAFHSFKCARDLGISTIYDLPIGFYTAAYRLLQLEITREPSLRPFVQSLNEPDSKLRKKDAEIRLATHIVCASSFTRDSIPEDVKRSVPVSCVPYGVSLDVPVKQWTKADEEGPLKIIFVGRLDPRKGLHILFQALSGLSADTYSLTLAGRWIPGFEQYLRQHFPIRYHNLGQVPHADLPGIYVQHQIFVFPSLFEGFGLVLLEAMASGIPVIATERTAAPDLAVTGPGVMLTPASDHAALRRMLESLNAGRKKLPRLGEAARKTAELFTWAHYRESLISELENARTTKS